jgi:ACT domain-containing protein
LAGVDSWKKDAIKRAMDAIEMVNKTGCSVTFAIKQCGATATTYYKYLKLTNI